jgi:hypothetical protein
VLRSWLTWAGTSTHQRLVGTGEHLDRLGELGVSRDLLVGLPVGADQTGQHLRIIRIGLGKVATRLSVIVEISQSRGNRSVADAADAHIRTDG